MGRFAIVFDTLDSDVETVARAAAFTYDVVLVSDARSPAVESLQEELGATLLVATHRVVDSGSGLLPSDAELAARLARAHVADPLGAIVYAGNSVMDLSWYESALSVIPRGRLLNGFLASSRRVLGTTSEYVELGPTTIALAGDAATSDFVITCNPSVKLPDWLPIEHVSVAGPGRVDRQARNVDVRGLDTGEAVSKVLETADQVPGLIAAIGSSPQQGAAIQALVPQSVAGRVIYCDSADPWSSELIDFSEGGHAQPLLEGSAAVRRSAPEIRVVAGDMEDLESLLRDLITEGSDTALVVTDDEKIGARFAGTRAQLADLGFVSVPRVPMGDLDPGRISGDAILIGRRARQAALEAASMSIDLRALIHRLTEPSLTASAVVGLVPGNFDLEEPLRLRTTRQPSDLGLRITPALLGVPNSPAQPHPPVPEFVDPKTWVGRLRWSTRSRLALPWRWGLLPRAMKGRW